VTPVTELRVSTARCGKPTTSCIPTIQNDLLVCRSTPLVVVSRYPRQTDFTLSSHLAGYGLGAAAIVNVVRIGFLRYGLFELVEPGFSSPARYRADEERLAATLILASDAPTGAICHLNAPKLLSARWKLSLMTCARADDHCIGGLPAVG
jgi:hypothetical protein